jgi:hypothetical protein
MIVRVDTVVISVGVLVSEIVIVVVPALDIGVIAIIVAIVAIIVTVIITIIVTPVVRSLLNVAVVPIVPVIAIVGVIIIIPVVRSLFDVTVIAVVAVVVMLGVIVISVVRSLLDVAVVPIVDGITFGIKIFIVADTAINLVAPGVLVPVLGDIDAVVGVSVDEVSIGVLVGVIVRRNREMAVGLSVGAP